MKRLTEKDAYWYGEEYWVSAKEPDELEIDDVYMKLKEYEDAEEQGLLLRLPCKMGDTLYIVGTKCLADQEPDDDYYCCSVDCGECQYDKELVVFERKASFYLLYVLMFERDDNWILGKTVFRTREEAEKALAEMGE